MMVETNKKIQYINSKWTLQNKYNKWLISEVWGSYSNVLNNVSLLESDFMLFGECLVNGYTVTA